MTREKKETYLQVYQLEDLLTKKAMHNFVFASYGVKLVCTKTGMYFEVFEHKTKVSVSVHVTLQELNDFFEGVV